MALMRVGQVFRIESSGPCSADVTVTAQSPVIERQGPRTFRAARAGTGELAASLGACAGVKATRGQPCLGGFTILGVWTVRVTAP